MAADPTYQPLNYHGRGGDHWHVQGTQTIEPGGVFLQNGTEQVNGVAVPHSITFAAASAGANVCEVTITVKDAAGNVLAAPFNFDVWLSDAATGAGLTATTASGAVAAKAANGTDLAVLTTKKATRVQTLATGIYVLSITDTAKTHFYVAAQVPGSGITVVGAQLTTANYG